MPQTIGEMIRRDAHIRWSCDAEEHFGVLDLQRVANLRGADTVLANRRPPCPVPGCPGRVAFRDHSRVFAESLDTIAAHHPEAGVWEDRRRAELKALGYRLELGRWTPPADGTRRPRSR